MVQASLKINSKNWADTERGTSGLDVVAARGLMMMRGVTPSLPSQEVLLANAWKKAMGKC